MNKLPLMMGAALVATFAFADKVTLKSGSFLTGKTGAITKETVKFASDDLGDIEIKVANIAKLETSGEHVVRYLDGREEKVALTVDGGVLVCGGKALDMTAVKATDPEPETWHGSINIGFQADRGNTHGNSVSILAKLNRRWESDRVNLDFGYYYEKLGTSSRDWTKSKDKIELEGQYDHFWSTRLYNYINARYDRDVIQELDRRIKVGAGFGWQWLEKREFESTGIWSFNQEIGAAYVSDKYKNPDPDRKDDYASFRYAHHLTYEPKWTKGLKFFHNFEYMPEVDDWEIYLMKCDVGFSTMLFWNIDLLAKIDWERNSLPSGDRRKNDYRYIIGLGYKW